MYAVAMSSFRDIPGAWEQREVTAAPLPELSAGYTVSLFICGVGIGIVIGPVCRR
jgi:hypothetical protein